MLNYFKNNIDKWKKQEERVEYADPDNPEKGRIPEIDELDKNSFAPKYGEICCSGALPSYFGACSG